MEILRQIDGRLAIAEVALRPRLRIGGELAAAERISALHEAAHKRCFIAGSLRCGIRIKPG